MRNKFNLHDSCEYYINNIDRITADGYLLTIDDILHVRMPTNDIMQLSVRIDDAYFHFVDAGGQNSERKKWIHCFDSAVTGIIYVASLSDYDLTLSDNEVRDFKSSDNNRNRLKEAIDLFRVITNWEQTSTVNGKTIKKPLIKDTANVILFLNKQDQFDEKIKHSPLNQCFNDFDDTKYDDKRRANAAKKFIENKFKETTKRRIYTHFTTAIDSKVMKTIIDAVKNTIINDHLNELF